MIEVSAAGRAGTPDEVGTVGALLMDPDSAFITGSDFLMDGGLRRATGTAAPKSRAGWHRKAAWDCLRLYNWLDLGLVFHALQSRVHVYQRIAV
jgi:hypothetical protein